MEDTDTQSEAAEDGGGWSTVARCRWWKLWARRQGGSQQREVDIDGADEARRQHTGDGDGANLAQRQHTGDRDISNRAMALPQAVDGAEHRTYEGGVRGQRWRTADIPRGTATPAAIMAEVAQLERENIGGGLSKMARGLTDLTHMAGFDTSPQGVAFPTDEEFWGRRLYKTTDRTAGERRVDSPTNGVRNGRGSDRVEEAGTGDPKHLGVMGPQLLGGPKRPRRTGGGGRTGPRGPDGATLPLLGRLGQVPQGGARDPDITREAEGRGRKGGGGDPPHNYKGRYRDPRGGPSKWDSRRVQATSTVAAEEGGRTPSDTP